MKSAPPAISRRCFLGAAVPCLGTLLTSYLPNRSDITSLQFNKSDIEKLRNELLQLVNAERVIAGVTALKLDQLACLVADQHALDMATGNFVSHWGRDGRKPYQRYSLAGGTDAVAENVSAASHVESTDFKFINLTLIQAHHRMHAEVPPNDGHRQTILASQHTHVGFGVALSGRELRFVELYAAKYLQIDPFPQMAKPKASLQIKGKLLDRKHNFYYVELFYEPPPQPPTAEFLKAPRPYGLPAEFRTLRPKLSAGTRYADGIAGTIDVRGDGGFQIPVKLDREGAGIYTIVIWLNRKGSTQRFPVTNVCIQVE